MKKAFSLIEIVLYVGLVAVIVSAIIGLGWSVITNGVKSAGQQEVFGTARSISERIKYEIRNAKGITSVTVSSITLQSFSSPTDTVIDWVGGNVRVNVAGAGAVNLNPSGTAVTNLTFTNNTSGSTKNISFIFTVVSTGPSTSQIYKADTTISGSAELRSNY